MKRIQELIQRDFSSPSISQKAGIFKDQILSFLEIITYPDILASLVLEQAVVTIYNCIFGPGGRRAEPFLQFLADIVASETESNPDLASDHLELALLGFSQVVELNSTAFILDSFKQLAQRFAGLLTALHALGCDSSLHQSLQHLERLQRHLEIGLSLPSLVGALRKVTTTKATAAFITQRDPPGGRHDNDHADISDIKIMPTFEEITSSRAEYLPVKDPRKWHVNAVAGLLDRNFRLLREDTIGQLRDVVHAELQPDTRQGTRRNQTRAYTYRQATVQSLYLHRLQGMQFLVTFTQPSNVVGMGKKKREEWWNLSKRLQSSALVCLLDPKGFAIFCTVSSPDRTKKREDADATKWKISGSLSEHPQYASVILELVEPTESNWQYILDCQTARRSASISLVEFPGILLPSFQPTLLALQKMKQAANIPMSEFLAPNDIESLTTLVDIPPPVYATSMGFSYDLRCLMDDGSSLKVQHSQPVEMDRLQKHSTLDKAQATALVRSLQRRIGLIQGPPGTGKSFTGVALIKVLLANKSKVKKGLGPIICVCYTNHALDQLLEDLQEKKITDQIIRIGSQSKSERLEPFNLRTVVREVEKTRTERRDQWELHNQFDFHDEEFRKTHLNSSGSDVSLKYHLQHFHPNHYSQFFEQDEEGFQRQSDRDPGQAIRSWLNGGKMSNDEPRSIDVLCDIHIDTMTDKERKALYDHWIETQRENIHSRAQSVLASHIKTKDSWNRIRDELDLRCLRSADIIGVTTTGLARNLNMLRRLPSKVLICEEAGEVLEAHLLTSLLPSIEHVILIGDHQQLRPQNQNYGLSRESHEGAQYALDRSLFERLVEPDDEVGIRLPFCTLETQRRMFPSISRLVRDTLYPQLQDAPSVTEYPEVVGMRKRLFWLDHRCPEGGAMSRDPTSTSHWNDHEIELTVALVNHLIRQGVYQGGEIAVLTPYLGQLHRMRRKLAESHVVTLGERDQEDLENAGFTGDEDVQKQKFCKSTLLQSLRVATVDNFQGEEAKVVVISLVRSNSQNRCGFLRTPNRINVLLSRAKHGMYIIGNSETSRGVDMWANVLDILEQDGNLGPNLELNCPRHPETPIAVTEPEHFIQLSPEGGCNLQCGKRLQCGHPCKQKCHSEMLHNVVYCLEPCPRPREGCTHSCPKFCGDTCPKKCIIPVYDAERVLPCGHPMVTLPCWQAQDLSTVTCKKVVQKQVPHCDHTVNVFCHVDVKSEEYRCPQMCAAALVCGHDCKRSCWQCITNTPEGTKIEHGVCTQRCERPYSTCSHVCISKCHGQEACPPCTSPCDVQCGHSRCPQKCSEPCAPCAVSECLSSCPHSTCSMPCAAPCDHTPCSLRCQSILPCGHQCPSVCGEICPPEICCQICGSDQIKDTEVDFILGESYREINLTENPCIFPQCGHFLTIESMDGQMDLKRHYSLDEMGRPTMISSSSEPFSIDDIRACGICRGSLRSLSRYGRLVRRALLDEATKKLILYVNREYVPLAQELATVLSELQTQTRREAIALMVFRGDIKIRLEGPPAHQISLMSKLVKKQSKLRWGAALRLRQKIMEYWERVKLDEQPFNQVRNMVEDARRRKKTSGQFGFDESVLQTKGQIQAASLLLRLDSALLGDFISMKKLIRAGGDQIDLSVNLEENRNECRRLISDSVASNRILQQTEGNIFLAQLYALELQALQEPAGAEGLRDGAKRAIEESQRLCQTHPGQTRGLAEEIEGTESMLNGSTFYMPVTNEERMAVLNAMKGEFRGTGHWYYCVNGHPFTIGECGAAMQLSRCPDCGSAVGGRNHAVAEGVTHAADLEGRLGAMQIGD